MVRFSVIYQGTQEVKATDLEGRMNYIAKIQFLSILCDSLGNSNVCPRDRKYFYKKSVDEIRDGLLNFQIRRIFIRYSHFYLRSIGSSQHEELNRYYKRYRNNFKNSSIFSPRLL